MTQRDQSAVSIMAGEYVLGTLDGEERMQFEMRLQQDPQLQAEVAAWRARLSPMLEGLEPVQPPPSVWQAIEADITPNDGVRHGGFWNSLVFWRNFGLASAVLLVALSLRLMQPDPGLVSTQRMMVVLNDRAQAGWVVGAASDGQFRVQAVQPTPLPAGQVCQLWMQMPDKSMVSLGVLPHAGVQTFRSPAPVPPDARYKVSIESADKLPLDKPSGQIVFEGELVSI